MTLEVKALINHFIRKLEKLSGFIMLGPFSSGHCSVRTVVGLAFFYEQATSRPGLKGRERDFRVV